MGSNRTVGVCVLIGAVLGAVSTIALDCYGAAVLGWMHTPEAAALVVLAAVTWSGLAAVLGGLVGLVIGFGVSMLGGQR